MKPRLVPRILERSRQSRLVSRVASLNSDYLLLALLVGVLVLNNAIWLRTDTYLPTVDGAYYLVNSLDALDTIKRPGSDVVERLYYQTFGPRPTFFFVAFSIPFYLLLNPSVDVAILGTNMIFYVVIVLATYGLGKLFFDRRVGLLAAFVVSVNPQVSSLSILYWPMFSVIAISALGTYLILRSDNFESKRHMLAFGVVFGVGLLIRPVFPAYFLLGPALFVTTKAVFSGVAVGPNPAIHDQWHQLLRNLRSRIVLGLLPALLIVVCLAGPFYSRYAVQMQQFVARTQPLSLSGQFGDLAGRESFFWYLANLPDDISLLFIVLFVIGVTLALAKHAAKTAPLLFWFAVAYILSSLGPVKGFWNFAPIYPAVAILSVFWIFHLENKGIQRALVGLILVTGLFTLIVASWNARPLPEPIMQAMKISTHPPTRGDWKLEEIVAFLGQQDSPSSPMRVGTAAALGGSTAPTLAYYTKLQGLEIEYLRNPLPALLDSDYVVARTGRVQSASYAAYVAWLVWSVVENETSAFHTSHVLIRQFSLPDGTQAQIYKRVRLVSCDEIVSIATEVIDLDPNNASAYLHLGDAYLSEGDFEQAIAAYVEAIEIQPGIASAHARLGQAYAAQGELEQAIGQYEQAIRLSPSTPRFHEVLGKLYRQQGRLEEAVAEYERAIELDPTRESAYWGLAVTYELLGRIEEAAAAYQEVLRINPTSEPAQRRLEQLSSSSDEDSQRTLWRSLGDVVAFLGDKVQPRSVRPGGTVQVTIWWQALAEMDRDYTVFVHVVDPDDRIWAQRDKLLQHEDRPTSAWEVGETVREGYELELAPDTPPGEYVVKAGIYYWETGERLPVWDENRQRVTDDAVLLEPITVTE